MTILSLDENEVVQDVKHLFDGKTEKDVIQSDVTISEECYFSEDGFGIYYVESEKGNFIIKGSFVTNLHIGQSYQVKGMIRTYRGEQQLSIFSIRPITPTTKRGIISYMQSLKGLKKRAEKIYEVFGEESIKVLLDEPEKIASKISGIGKTSVVKWSNELKQMKALEELMISLLDYGLKLPEVKKLHEKFGEDLLSKLQENPYFLGREVRGYGFKRCDDIAMNMGYKVNGLERVKAGIQFVLEEASNSEGHTHLPLDVAIEKVENLLGIYLNEQQINELLRNNGEVVHLTKNDITYTIPRESLVNQTAFAVEGIGEATINAALEALVDDETVVIDEDCLYLKKYHTYEITSAKHIMRLAKEKPSTVDEKLFMEELDNYLKENNIVLEEKQYRAVVEMGMNNGSIFALNGSAGCGKTFVLKIIIRMIKWRMKEEGLRMNIGVFAPTGKASKVATKAIGLECTTIHRGLGYVPVVGFNYNRENKLPFNVVVIDESTMIDIELLFNLLEAIKTGTKVIFIGDFKQLPSVGAGNCFKDLLASALVKTVTLDVVKRQGALSGLLKNANRIIQGEMILSENETKDAFVINRHSTSQILSTVVASARRLVTLGNSIEDIQILAPMRKTEIGTNHLNYIMQNEFNPKHPGSKEIFYFEYELKGQKYKLNFRKNDKVIHTRNNYEIEWFDENGKSCNEFGITNGETGVIADIYSEKIDGKTMDVIKVRYEDRFVYYKEDFSELELAFALTIHKSQGSQWKNIILPCGNVYYHMLQNNIIYTGYTRSVDFCAVIGQDYAIKKSIETFTIQNRYTNLKKRLDSYVTDTAA